MPINLKSLPPIVWGCDYARLLQGVNIDGTIPTASKPAPFLATDTLIATVSPGQGLPSLFNPTMQWVSPSLAQVAMSIGNAQAKLLSIDTSYLVEVTASRGGVTYPLVAGYLPVLPAPSTQASAAPPDLCTIPYAAQLLAQLNLNEAQLEAVPTLVTASSDAFRSWCNRRFDQGMVTEEVPVQWDGTIRLARPPINWIARIQSRPMQALSVSNGTANLAWVNLFVTGDVAGGQTIAGMTLNWESNGVTTTFTEPYTTNMTIAGLATAINAVGNGWTATADSVLGALPVTELMDGLASKGTSTNDEPQGAAIFNVYAGNIVNSQFVDDDGQRTGMVWVGQYGRGNTSIAQRWGPGGEELFSFVGFGPGKVKVTYNGGFATVPYEVQLACVELVKAQLFRLKTDFTLLSETGDKYSYQINPREVDALPRYVLQGIARYRIHNA